MKPLAQRVDRIVGKGAYGIWEKATALEAQGREMIHLEIGEPDFATPAHIVDAADRGIRAGRTKYGPGAGDPMLREAVAAYFSQSRDVVADAREVLITPGVKGALFLTLLALVEHGDEVVIPTPHYPPYTEMVRFAGGRPVLCPLHQENGFQIDPDELATHITPRTKAIILNTPNNPTGVIYDVETLAAVARIAQQHDLWVIADEVYHQIYFTRTPPPSIYSLPGMAERTILLDGFSKAYAMTGWRLGFGIFPGDLARNVTTLMVSQFSNLPLFIQDAGLTALQGDQSCVQTMRQEYHIRRDSARQLIDSFPGVTYVVPDGAFYILMNIAGTGIDSSTLADRLLQVGVALLPAGAQHMRLAFTKSETDVRTALERMGALLAT